MDLDPDSMAKGVEDVFAKSCFSDDLVGGFGHFRGFCSWLGGVLGRGLGLLDNLEDFLHFGGWVEKLHAGEVGDIVLVFGPEIH